jgi:SAM-dependent methyltransferase
LAIRRRTVREKIFSAEYAFVNLLPKRLKNVIIRQAAIDSLYSYWKDPKDIFNSPEGYLQGHERSEFLVNLVKPYLKDTNASILELGCNVGRNLQHLLDAGFSNLSGVEVNGNALMLMKEKFPKLASQAKIYHSTIEDWFIKNSSAKFDLIFVMAVLEHIHSDSEWIFPEVSKMSEHLIVTIEDEETVTPRHFPRNYRYIFENYGMRHIKEINCVDIPGLNKNFYARVFLKE